MTIFKCGPKVFDIAYRRLSRDRHHFTSINLGSRQIGEFENTLVITRSKENVAGSIWMQDNYVEDLPQ